MRLETKKPKFILFTLFVISLFSITAEAGIFKILAKLGDNASDVGGKVVRKLDDVTPGLSRLPDEAGVKKVGLDLHEDGSISLLDDSGQKWKINRNDDVSLVLVEIQKSQNLIKGSKSQSIKIYLSKNQLDGQIDPKLFSKFEGLHLIDDGKAYPLSMLTGHRSHWRVELDKDLSLNFKTVDELEEGLWQLNKSLNHANMRLVSFSPDLDGLPASVQSTLHGTVPELTMINPAYLENSLNVLRHQTLVVTGKRSGSILEIKGINGKSHSVDLNELESLAQTHDINLMILESSKSAQLGSRTFPWNKAVRQSDLEKAFSSETYGGFLSSLSGKNKASIFELEKRNGNFVSFRKNPENETIKIQATDEGITGVEVAVHTTYHVGKIFSHSREYDQEMNRRIIPWIPVWIQNAYFMNIFFGFVAAGLLALGLTEPLWEKIWPAKKRVEYDSLIKFQFFYLLRALDYIFVFLGLFGTVLFLIRLVIYFYHIVINFFKMVIGFFSFLH